MTSRRIAKLEQAILEQVSSSILFDLKDPRVRHVTVTRVEVSPDVQHARIYVSVLGDEKAQALCLHGLQSARGFLQAKVAARIRTRYTPHLSFAIDPGIKKSIEVSRLLREVLSSGESSPESAGHPGQRPEENEHGHCAESGKERKSPCSSVTGTTDEAGLPLPPSEPDAPLSASAADIFVESAPSPKEISTVVNRPSEKRPPDS